MNDEEPAIKSEECVPGQAAASDDKRRDDGPCEDCSLDTAIILNCEGDRNGVNCAKRKFTYKDLLNAIIRKNTDLLYFMIRTMPLSRFKRLLNSKRFQRTLEMEYDIQMQLVAYGLGTSYRTVMEQQVSRALCGNTETGRKAAQYVMSQARLEMASHVPAPPVIQRQEQYKLMHTLIESGNLPPELLAMRMLSGKDAMNATPRLAAKALSPARLRRRLPPKVLQVSAAAKRGRPRGTR